MDNQRNISAIAWDLDNTLFNRDAAFRKLIETWLAEVTGKSPASLEIREMADKLMEMDCSGYGDRMKVCEHAITMAGAKISALSLRDEIHERLPRFVSPDDRITRLLTSLHGQFHMAIVTNGSSDLQRAKIASAGLDTFFPADMVIVSAEVGCKKPDASIFEIVAKRLCVPANEVLFVGDHWENDILGPARMGMKTCWVSLGRGIPQGTPADIVVHQPWELTFEIIQTPISRILA